MTRGDWRWGTQPSADADLGVAVATEAVRRAAAKRLNAQTWTFEPDVTPLEINIRGYQGELAFRRFTGRSIPSIEEMLANWKNPDVLRFQVKHTSNLSEPTFGMTLTQRHLLESPCDRYVLMYAAERPRWAIVGTITKARAWEVRTTGRWQKPGNKDDEGKIVVPWVAFEPYAGPLDPRYTEPVVLTRPDPYLDANGVELVDRIRWSM